MKRTSGVAIGCTGPSANPSLAGATVNGDLVARQEPTSPRPLRLVPSIGEPPAAAPPRSLSNTRCVATVVFTDIAGSTRHATALGDTHWYEVLQHHHALSRLVIEDHGGRFLRTIGDGVLAIFDLPSQAIHSMLELRDVLAQHNLAVRVGMHTGEVLPADDDVAGLAVAIAARIVHRAPPGVVVVSRTVADVAAGSDVSFTRRRPCRLRGVPGIWTTWAVRRQPAIPIRQMIDRP